MSIYEVIHKLTLSTPGATGEMLPRVREMIRSTPSHNLQVLLAYPPKVGGTFMRHALGNLLTTNFQTGFSRGSYANSDYARDLYFPTVLNQHLSQTTRPNAWVMHLHVYPSRHVTDMIEAFGIPVIIATRDILDSLLSGIEMTESMERNGEYIDDAIITNGRPFPEMTPDERRHGVVNYVTLWYARFYAQWLRYDRECREAGKRRPLWLRFDDLKGQPDTVLAHMASHCDKKNSYSAEQLREALEKSMADKPTVRFNKGITGRGKRYFTVEEQERIFEIIGKAGQDDLRRLGVLNDCVPIGSSV